MQSTRRSRAATGVRWWGVSLGAGVVAVCHAPRAVRAVLCVGIGVAGLVFAGSATGRADEIFFPSAEALNELLMRGVAYLGVAIAYPAALVLIEALVFRAVLGLAYRWCLLYSFAVNVASTAFGSIWYVLGPQMGWKTAMLAQRYDMLGTLVLRSFLVTLALELSLMILMLARRPFAAKTILGATALANTVTYVATGGILAAIVPHLPEWLI